MFINSVDNMLILYSVELNSLLLEISLRAPKSTTTATDFGCLPSYFYDWCAFFRDHQIPMPLRRKMSWNVLPSLTVKVKSRQKSAIKCVHE